MQLDERTGPFRIAFPTANSLAASIVEPLPRYTRPVGDGVIDFGLSADVGGNAPLRISVLPFGVGTAAQTMLLNLYGWRLLPAKVVANRQIWVPFFLSSFTCTLCTVPGLDHADVSASQLFCGTIVVVKGGVAGEDYSTLSPTGNSVAWLWQKLYGSSIVSVVTGLNGSSTSCNALVGII